LAWVASPLLQVAKHWLVKCLDPIWTLSPWRLPISEPLEHMLTTCCNAINLAQVPSTIYETEIMETTHHQMHPHWTLLENKWVCHLLLTSYCHLLLTSYWHLISLFLFLCLQPMWSNASRLSPVFASGQEQANLLYLVLAHVVPAWLGNNPISADFLSRVWCL
jgi:hypothetical protein